MTESARTRYVRRLLAERGWNQSDLVREAGVNKNTVSDFMNDKGSSKATIAKIEAALGLTPGTLGGSGEDREPPSEHLLKSAPGPDLKRVGNDTLVAEISERLRQQARVIEQLESLADKERRRERQRKAFLAAINEDSSEDERWVEQEWVDLVHKSSDEDADWDAKDEAQFVWLQSYVDALVFAQGSDMVLLPAETRPGSVPERHQRKTPDNAEPEIGSRPGNVRPLNPKHQRMLEVAQLVDEAAYGDVESARRDEAGEESQDDGSHEPR